MRLFDLGQGPNRLVEGSQRCLARVRKLYLHEGHVRQAQALGIDDGAIAEDLAFGLQTLDPGLARRLGKIDPAAQFSDAQPPIARQLIQNLPVDLV